MVKKSDGGARSKTFMDPAMWRIRVVAQVRGCASFLGGSHVVNKTGLCACP